MSHNQSRVERSDSTQYKRTGRSGSSNQQRQFSGGVPTKGGGGASPAPTNPSNRSFKKYNNNAPVGQPGAGTWNVDSSEPAVVRAELNGARQQQPTQRVPEAPVSKTSSNLKPPDASSQKTHPPVPKSPSSNITSTDAASNITNSSSESKAPATPGKAPGDASKSFPFQFGSISPGFMNGMQIPARTSSAPPNLDEQKKDQARYESSRTAPALPTPSGPKQHFPKKDAGILNQPNYGEAHLVSKPKRDTQFSTAPTGTQAQKPVLHPIPSMAMQLPFHQPQIPVQFGGPNSQMQSQVVSGTSLPMPIPMSLPLGNQPVQHSMFVPGLQPLPMQSQGMLHQGHGLNFSPQMGPQLSPQLGNMGMSLAPQFPQQTAIKYSGSRKTVKITHPETHEELRLDSSPAPRLHPSVQSQSQPISSFPHNIPVNFYPSSYNSTPLFYPPASSFPLSSSHVPPTSQTPRHSSQVTVKPPVASHAVKEPLPHSGALSVGKVEASKSSRLKGGHPVSSQNEIEPSSLSSLPQPKAGLEASYVPAASSSPVIVERDASASHSVAIDGRVSVSTSSPDGAEHPYSIKDKPKVLGGRGQHEQDLSVSTSLSSLPSQLPGAVTKEAKLTSSGTNLVSETAMNSLSTAVAASCEASSMSSEGAAEEKTGNTFKGLGAQVIDSTQSDPEVIVRLEQGEAISAESSLETPMRSLSLESPETVGKIRESSDQQVTSTNDGSLEHTQETAEEFSGYCSNDVKTEGHLSVPAGKSGGQDPEISVSGTALSEEDDTYSTSDVLSSVPKSIGVGEKTVENGAIVDRECAPILDPPPEGSMRSENEDMIGITDVLVSPSPSSIKEKGSDLNVAKSVAPRSKKKKKDLYRKAEATGTSSDLYMAYKGPEERKETATMVEASENSSSNGEKQTSAGVSQENAAACEKPAPSKVEPDDWEDAAEMSSPELGISRNENQDIDDGNGLTTKKYSRDFLLKFVEQCTDLPEGFEIPTDIADTLMAFSFNIPREPYPGAGRNVDWPVGGSRPDRRGSGLGDDDRWNKFPGPVMVGRGDMWTDAGYMNNVGFRPGQAGNYGVLRNPRAQTPQYAGGILSGPMQSLGPQGGPQRNNVDSDRWQRGAGFHKGLMPSPQMPMPSPQMPMQMMHKAERKYEVGKVSDEEEAKQRQLKAILNKLTPQNFEKLFDQVKEVNIDNVITLSGVISQIFDKALMEPTFCEMYANFCFHLAADLPDLSVDNEKITFKRLLLNKCQEEFERGEREEEEANKVEEEGEVKQSAEEREEKRLRARRRMLGNIRLIGELYKKRMLTERIMHECINKLLGQYQNPDEENIEALCKLMSTIGEMIDHPKAKEHMDAYYDIMAQLSNNMKLSSRVRFMLKDAIDLRKNKWQQRRKVEGPKKIEEVHRDAAQERAQVGRLGRAPSMGNSGRRGPPMDFGPRSPSVLPSPSSHIGGFRGPPPQLRGYGSQDVRTDERHSSVPLPQRPPGDDSITLGPQGGLARGMAFRGQPSAANIPLAEMHGAGDGRRMGPGQNGFSSMPERVAYGQREDFLPRYTPDKFVVPPNFDQSHPQERNFTYESREVRNTDRASDGSLPSSPSPRGAPPSITHDVSSDKVWPIEKMRDKSMAAIKEFYSARDEKEVALCIKDLNAPKFYPSMISLWVTDSFERKDLERDLLSNLLLNLTKPQDAMISEDQLIKGFEYVLAVLEDAVNDAPRAAEFLGRMFAKIILENIITLSEIGGMIYEGGEEQGQLVDIGLAAEVLGSIFDIIKSEKGESVLNGIRSSSNLRLEDFRPAGYNKALRIDKYI